MQATPSAPLQGGTPNLGQLGAPGIPNGQVNGATPVSTTPAPLISPTANQGMSLGPSNVSAPAAPTAPTAPTSPSLPSNLTPGQMSYLSQYDPNIQQDLLNLYQSGQQSQQTMQQAQQAQSSSTSFSSPVINFGIGFFKQFASALNTITEPINKLIDPNYDNSLQAQDQQYLQPQGTAQKVGGYGADVALGLGAASGGELLTPAFAAAGLGPTASTIAAQGVAQGVKGFATTEGSLSQRTSAGVNQGVIAAVTAGIIPPALGAFKLLFSSPAAFTPVVEDGISSVSGFDGGGTPTTGIGPAETENAQAANNLYTANQNLGKSAQAIIDAQTKLSAAAKAAGEAPQIAVDNYDAMVQQVTGQKSALGTAFSNNIDQLTTDNPSLQLPLSKDTVETLNNLHDSQNFALPKFIPQEGTGNLNPGEARDLLQQLNNATYSTDANGQLVINQKFVGIQQDIKDAASQAFGSQWDNIYSDYSKGVNAFNKLDDIINFSRSTTASDNESAFQKIQALSKSPTGRIFLKNTIADVQAVHPNINLSDPIQAIQQVQETQNALEEAQSNLEDAQKAHTTNEKAANTANKQFTKTQDNFQSVKQKAVAANEQAQAQSQAAAKAASAAKYKVLKKTLQIVGEMSGAAAINRVLGHL